MQKRWLAFKAGLTVSHRCTRRVPTVKQSSAIPHIIFLDSVNKKRSCEIMKMLKIPMQVVNAEYVTCCLFTPSLQRPPDVEKLRVAMSAVGFPNIFRPDLLYMW